VVVVDYIIVNIVVVTYTLHVVVTVLIERELFIGRSRLDQKAGQFSNFRYGAKK
jgi:Zn-dependent M32 family carboxypeptidase